MQRETAKHFSPRRESVVNRGQASALAASDPRRAFAIAKTIPDGWYRCQAMATVGLHAREDLSEQAFRQARAAAAAGDDAYQRAGALAFAITAALGRGRKDLATAMLADALALIPSVEPMASRAYALNLLWSTIARNGDRLMREAVIAALSAHIHPDRSWRAKRLYREVAAKLAWDRPDLARKLISAMPDGKARAFIERHRAAGERWQP